MEMRLDGAALRVRVQRRRGLVFYSLLHVHYTQFLVFRKG